MDPLQIFEEIALQEINNFLFMYERDPINDTVLVFPPIERAYRIIVVNICKSLGLRSINVNIQQTDLRSIIVGKYELRTPRFKEKMRAAKAAGNLTFCQNVSGPRRRQGFTSWPCTPRGLEGNLKRMGSKGNSSTELGFQPGPSGLSQSARPFMADQPGPSGITHHNIHRRGIGGQRYYGSFEEDCPGPSGDHLHDYTSSANSSSGSINELPGSRGARHDDYSFRLSLLDRPGTGGLDERYLVVDHAEERYDILTTSRPIKGNGKMILGIDSENNTPKKQSQEARKDSVAEKLREFTKSLMNPSAEELRLLNELVENLERLRQRSLGPPESEGNNITSRSSQEVTSSTRETINQIASRTLNIHAREFVPSEHVMDHKDGNQLSPILTGSNVSSAPGSGVVKSPSSVIPVDPVPEGLVHVYEESALQEHRPATERAADDAVPASEDLTIRCRRVWLRSSHFSISPGRSSSSVRASGTPSQSETSLQLAWSSELESLGGIQELFSGLSSGREESVKAAGASQTKKTPSTCVPPLQLLGLYQRVHVSSKSMSSGRTLKAECSTVETSRDSTTWSQESGNGNVLQQSIVNREYVNDIENTDADSQNPQFYFVKEDDKKKYSDEETGGECAEEERAASTSVAIRFPKRRHLRVCPYPVRRHDPSPYGERDRVRIRIQREEVIEFILNYDHWAAYPKSTYTLYGYSLRQLKLGVGPFASNWFGIIGEDNTISVYLNNKIQKYFGDVNVMIPTQEMLAYQGLKMRDISKLLDYVVELYCFKSNLETKDLLNIFKSCSGKTAYLKWLNGQHCLLVLGSAEDAEKATALQHSLVKARPMTRAGPAARRFLASFFYTIYPILY